MNTPFKIHIFWIIIISFLFVTCAKDEKQATKSIEGDWEITSINSLYGNFTGTGFDPDTTIQESGILGTFYFMDDTAEFNFIRNDTTNVGSGAWDIKSEKVNAGFSKVTIFTLTIDNHFVFDVEFEDGTKNSEKKAQSATFIQESDVGYGVMIEMTLEKI